MKTHTVPPLQSSNRLERPWTHRLEEQAVKWQSGKPDQRYVTNTGVPVVRLHKRAAAKRRAS
jgi:hypothetical protein